MYHHYQTWGIFWGKENRGEADQMFFIFTEQFGAIEVLAKAIRKITSKLRSAADIFYLAEIEFIQGRTYKILTEATALEKFRLISQNPEKLETASRLGLLIKLLIDRSEKDEAIWQLVKSTFYFLNDLPETDKLRIQAVYFYFLWNFLATLGYQPQLYNCPGCSQKIKPGTLYFVPDFGGVVCGACSAKLNQSETEKELIKVDTVKLLRIFLQEPIGVLSRLLVKPHDLADLAKISEFSLRSFQEPKNKLQ